MAHKDAVGLCLICGELSFGKHYGCLSCLGCKTFFRRAVMHDQDTICKKPNICVQEMCARRLCRSCRFKRCLDMGMSKEALQPRRDLIGRRKKRLPPQSSTQIQQYYQNSSTMPSTSGSDITPSPTNNQIFSPNDSFIPFDGNNNLLDVISSLAATDKAIRARKFEMIRARTEAKRLADVASKGSRVVQQHDTLMKIVLCSDLCNVTQIEMFSMLEWVQTIPAFSSLHLPDKMLLLKRFAMPCNVIEYGYFTAQIGLDDVWLISNGTCMPRSVNVLPDESKTLITEDRKWRQEKLYKQMTDRCIDGLVIPLKRLQLTPEELVVLKILLLFSCGNHTQKEEGTSFINDESRRIALEWKNKVIASLFQFYRSIGHKSSAERFGNVVLLISGIVSAASATLESYQIMRLFKFANFDRISEQLLFDID